MSYWFSENSAPEKSVFRSSTYNSATAKNINNPITQSKPTHFNSIREIEQAYPPVALDLNNSRSSLRHTQTTNFSSTQRRPVGLAETVQLRARLEDRAEDQRKVIRDSDKQQRLSEWYARQEKNKRAAAARRNKSAVLQQVELANEELMLLRRAKLKQKLAEDYREWVNELELRGLTILHHEP
jgi:hypothetical protein